MSKRSKKDREGFWARVAGFWMKRSVLSIFIIVFLLASGGYVYSSVISRDGFPALSLPLVQVSVEHDIDNTIEADEEIATVLNSTVGDIAEVEEVQTSSVEGAVVSAIVLTPGSDSELLSEQIKNDLDEAGLTNSEVLELTLDNIGFSLSISSTELEGRELEALATKVADRLKQEDDLILDATASSNYDANGNLIGFGRYGSRDDSGEFTFSSSAPLLLQKQASVDTLTFSDEVTVLITEDLVLDGTLPEHANVEYVGDGAQAIRDQIAGLEVSLFQSLAVVAVMVMVLVGWRAAAVSIVFIPTVMAGTILVMYALGATLNTISLFGLLLVLGLFIDDIIVIVEAIDKERQRGLKRIDAVKAALSKIGSADVMGSLTTIAVFVPLLTITGLLGELVFELPEAVIIALSLSVVLALTAFLWLSSLTVSRGEKGSDSKEAKDDDTHILDKVLNPITKVGAGIINAIGNTLVKFVSGYLKRKTTTLLVAIFGIVAIVLGASYATKLDFEIFPSPDDLPEVNYSITFNGASSVEEAEEIAAETDQLIVAELGDQIEKVVYSTGTIQSAEVGVQLAEERTMTSSEIEDEIASLLEENEKVSVAFGDQGALEARFSADSIDELVTLTAEIPRFIQTQDGANFATVAPLTSVVQRWDDSLVATALISVEDDVTSDDFFETLGEDAEADGLGVEITADQVNTQNAIEKSQEDSFSSMAVVFLVSIVAVSIILMIHFRSIILPGLILGVLPLSIPLLFPGLKSVNAELSFFVMLGLAALIGIAVNNSIMLIDYAERAVKEEGKSARQSIIDALSVRFRPLIVTVLTTVVGIFPLTSDPQFSGLAWTVIFGMTSSTLMVITVFPAYYEIVQGPRLMVLRFFKRLRKKIFHR